MYILNSTLRKIQILLGGATTTDELDVVTHYEDRTFDETGNALSANVETTNGATPVDIVDAPLSGKNRYIHALSVYNNDSVDATVTIRYNDNGTSYTIIKVTLNTGEQLYYENEYGWSVLSSEGHLRSV